MMRLLITIACLLIGYLSGNAQIQVSAALDNSKILIGDQANLHLEANYPTDHTIKGVDLSVLDSIFAQVDPAKDDPDPGILEILEQTEWETLTHAGTTTYRKDIKLTCWKDGVYFIPQIRFELESKGTTFTKATNKLTLLVSSPITESEVVDTVQIAPIKNIIEEQWQFSDFLPVVYAMGGFVLVLLAIIFLILYISKRKQGPPPIDVVKRPAHEIAFHKLEQLKAQELWQKGEVKAYQSQLTYICREYIENRYDVPALESTTGGILTGLKKLDFPNDLVEKMREMLQLADMVKFAKAKPPEEMNTRLMAYAEEIIQTTKLEVSEEEQQKLQASGAGIEETVIAPTVYAHPGRRFLAYFLDGIIFQIGLSILLFVPSLLLVDNEPGSSLLIPAVVSLILTLVFGFFYFAFMHARKKQTLGKMILGIELIQTDGKNLSLGKAFLRFCIKIISFILLFLPFLPILFNRQKQGLHDMVANTIVVKKLK